MIPPLRCEPEGNPVITENNHHCCCAQLKTGKMKVLRFLNFNSLKRSGLDCGRRHNMQILEKVMRVEHKLAAVDITRLSSHYEVRTLTDSDVGIVLDLCQKNTLFYEFTKARPTREEVKNDMTITPPGIDPSDKYFVGFFEGADLVAVMDLIDGYPGKETAYIGLFMVNREYQGKQIGSAIVGEVEDYLKAIGKTAIRLAIDKGNPQSTHFWKKNGFKVITEADVDGWTKLVAEKSLLRIIAACGNDCSACPRYAAHPFEKTEEELHHTADLNCREACTEEEYEQLKKAFFEKEKNLSEIKIYNIC